MKSTKYILILFSIMQTNCSWFESKTLPSLKTTFSDEFAIGVAMNTNQITGIDSVGRVVIEQQFNSIVAENCMKIETIQPREGEFDFELSDRFVNFGLNNKMKIIGHTLIWHNQVPAWFFVDSNGTEVSRDVLIERMKKHITTLVSRYKTKVDGWDVVNEALNDDGSYRESLFYKIIGPEYIQLAFEFAHAADPNVELYYNDFNLYKPAKRFAVVDLVNNLKENGCRIDAVGEQGHYVLGVPVLAELENTIISFSDLGIKTAITELDVSVLPNPTEEVTDDLSKVISYKPELDPYVSQLPDSVEQTSIAFYVDLFKLFLKHKESIDRVTLWGLNDEHSWRNNWPVKGRTDYPLLFDRSYSPKNVLKAIIKEASLNKKKLNNE